jgi:thiol peroxidase
MNHTVKEVRMTERTGVITMKGNPLTLTGQEAKVGEPAPDFEVLANDLSPFRLSSLKGKVAIICSVPSLDTPTCDIETRWFNEEAAKLGPDVFVLTISMDLPKELANEPNYDEVLQAVGQLTG